VRRPLRRTTWTICAVFWATVFRLSAGLAQTADPITPSGLNTQVNLSSAPPAGEVQYDITGGTRAGANLFHSFSQFDVPANNIVNFLNDSGLATSNILGRVNGGNPSSIFGTVQTSGFGNANLFLMNPSGIMFGPTASLNVGGSVTFTTADYLRLEKVGNSQPGIFHADPTQVSLLTSAPVDAFGFLGANTAAITVQASKLMVPEGQGVSLIGGNVTIQDWAPENGTAQAAHLSAPNGQINLATARSPGEFLQDLTAASNINGASFTSFASVHLEPGSTVDVSHTVNGKVLIRGGQLVLEIENTVLDTAISSSPTTVASNQDTIVLAPKSSIISQTSSLDPSPDISISADRIAIVGVPGSKENFFEKPFTGMESTTNGAGSAGDITVRTTGDLAIAKVVNLQSFAMPQSTGTAGNIKLISTKGNILMTEGAVEAQVLSLTFSSGNTGTITVSALEGDIVLDGGNLYTQSQGSGRAGSVEITAKNLSMHAGLLSNDNFFSTHKPGGITVTLSGKLTMKADPSLDVPDFVFPNSLIATSAFNPSTEAPAGDITLTAKDIVATEGSLITSETFAAGAGGQLKIFADTLQLKDGSQIKSGSTIAPPVGDLPRGITPTGAGGNITIHTLGPTGAVLINGPQSGIFADTQGTGAGGAINLTAKTLTLQNGGTISALTKGFAQSATGGSIDISTTDHITMTNRASITAGSANPDNPNAGGKADAGSISINAGQQLDVQDSFITTKAEKASGGNIDIRAIDRVRFVNSQISASVGADKGNGGNITIDPNIVVLKNSQILARAVQGHGGNITITTPLFLADPRSIVDASSQFGLNGSVTIQSPTSNLSGTVGQLASKTNPPQVLLQNRCIALAGGEQSTFILAGRDTLPSEPGGWLSSPVAMEHWTGEVPEEHVPRLMVRSRGWNTEPALVMSKDETTVLSLRRLTPPGFLVRSFAGSAATGCSS
jgi:filamentous hemagglutinin family protein